ncbi:MAG: alpha/beta hydrolase [Pseudomonadota bacterium]
MDAHFNAKHVDEFKSGWAASVRDNVQFYETDRVLFRYREVKGPEGAPTLVFSVDPPVSLEQYDELMGLLCNDFRVVVFELPGMGFSPGKRAFRFGFRETNDQIARFLEAIAGPGSILAFSCGAGLASLDLATRRPGLVSAQVLIQVTNVAGFAEWKTARDPKRILAKPILGQLAMRKLAKKRMPAWFRLSLGRKEHVPEFCACSGAAMDHGALWSLASAYQVYLRPDISLAQVNQPTLVIWGEADGSHPIEHRDAILSVVPAADIRSFRKLGHFPELQDPLTIAQTICGWTTELNR